MLRFAVSSSCLSLAFVGAAAAGPMPNLPELPPLPIHYESQGHGGPYAGILSGYADGVETGLGIALVVTVIPAFSYLGHRFFTYRLR